MAMSLSVFSFRVVGLFLHFFVRITVAVGCDPHSRLLSCMKQSSCRIAHVVSCGVIGSGRFSLVYMLLIVSNLSPLVIESSGHRVRKWTISSSGSLHSGHLRSSPAARLPAEALRSERSTNILAWNLGTCGEMRRPAIRSTAHSPVRHWLDVNDDIDLLGVFHGGAQLDQGDGIDLWRRTMGVWRTDDGRKGHNGDSEWQDQCRRWTGNRNGRCCWQGPEGPGRDVGGSGEGGVGGHRVVGGRGTGLVPEAG